MKHARNRSFVPAVLTLPSFGLRLSSTALAAAALFCPTPAHADNPIVQTLYTADPAPLVHEGTLYLYTTHDEDVTVNDFFTMNDWRVYSTKDVVNWTDHGSPLHYRDFAWAGGSAWAGQVIFRNDKFYFYVPVVRTNGGNAIGVAVSDSPTGPFTDAIGAPLVTSDCGDIDPSPFIDDDGQAYLFWGNPNLCYVKLNEDMTSYQGGVVKVQMNTGSFGVRADAERPTSYEEGPWFYKREGQYYLVYPGGPLPEHIAYSTSPSAAGPWTYKSVIMPAEGGSFTNHPGIVDFGGKSLFFYHNGALPGGGGFKRSVAVEEFTYGADGSIPQLRMTDEGAGAVAALNPFERVEAETIAWSSGIETEPASEGGMNVTDISNGDYIKVKEVDFGSGATGFEARVAAAAGGGAIELHLDAVDGTLVASCPIEATGGAETWATQACEVEGATGKHDLFLRFTGGGFKFDWWKFSGPGAVPDDMTSTAPDSSSVTSDTSTDGETSGASGSMASSTAGNTSNSVPPATAPSSNTTSVVPSPVTSAGNTGAAPTTTAGPPVLGTTSAAATSDISSGVSSASVDTMPNSGGGGGGCSAARFVTTGVNPVPWHVSLSVLGTFFLLARRSRRTTRVA